MHLTKYTNGGRCFWVGIISNDADRWFPTSRRPTLELRMKDISR